MNSQITEREQSVIYYLTQGFTNVEIAKKLHISAHTVKAHLEAIYKKLEVYNRVQAVTKSILLNLVDVASIIK